MLTLAPKAVLIYMSIHDLLDDAVARGLLFRVEPTMPSEPVNRAMYAAAPVQRLIAGPWADKAEEYRCGMLWADFDRFVEGRLVPVALDSPYRKPKNTYLSRLHPGSDEVWQIRSRAPRPSIRVFGRFAYRDCFVALFWRLRSELGGPGSSAYRQEMRNCLAAWRHIFPHHDPLTGSTVDEYISEKAYPVRGS